MNPKASKLFKRLTHPVQFRMFLLFKLPSAFFSGVRIDAAGEEFCITRVRFRWFTQNPFRSTYFACLSMAAEMSTGALAMAQVYERQPPVSMLVVKSEAQYFKKATGVTRFRCDEGQAIGACIEQAVNNGEAQSIRVRSVGTNDLGELIAEFFFTWSFRQK